MEQDEQEGADPAARQAAKEWRKRFGREGHEGSYAPQLPEEGHDEEPDPSRTSPAD